MQNVYASIAGKTFVYANFYASTSGRTFVQIAHVAKPHGANAINLPAYLARPLSTRLCGINIIIKDIPDMKKKQSFGVTLLKTFAIAVVFGVVAACAFEATAYYFGDQLGFPFIGVQPETGSSEQEEASVTEEEPEPETEKQLPEKEETTPQVSAVSASGKSDADLVEGAMPSIVAITNISTVEYSTFWGQRGSYESESAGSGIIIERDDSRLYVVTNEHVVSGSEKLFVQFGDEENVIASIKGSDPSRDIAVVEVELSEIPKETLDGIKVAVIGDSTALRVGDPAIAIGNALGYGQTTTKGVISALDREVTARDSTTGISITNHCIQTDAAINPGNSGGALLNEKGEVVGINEIKYSSTEVEGIGYAIPIHTAMPVINEIIEKEHVTDERTVFLGIQGVEIDEEDAAKFGMPRGIYLSQVVPGSAAEDAGLQVGDIITAFDGKTVTTQEELTSLMKQYEPGDVMEIIFQRARNGNYEEYRTEAVLGTRNE